MKRLFEIIAPHWQVMVVGAFCSLIVSAINGGFAWFVQTIVDDIFVSGDKQILFMVSVGVIVAFILRGIFIFLQNYLMVSVGGKIVHNMRNKLYEHMIHLPMKSYGQNSTGSMMSKVLADVGALQMLLAVKIRTLFVSSFTIVILTGVAVYRRWDLTLFALGILPIAFYFVGKIGKKVKEVTKRVQRRLATITETLTEGLTGVKVIKSFVMENSEVQKFSKKSYSFYEQFMKSQKLLLATGLIMEFVVGIGVAIIIFYGGTLVSDEIITSGEFFSFMAAILMIFTPAKRLAQVNNGLQQAKAYVIRIDEVLNSTREPQGELEPGEFKDSISFKDVSFKYFTRDVKAINNLSLHIKKGEVVAFVGSSGSGKSTLMDLLARFYSVDEGTIALDEININDMTSSALRTQIGIVSQNVILFNDTIKANIAFGKADASDEVIQSAAKAAYAHDFITELPDGYDTEIGEAGALLSGGQRQRISIARAILKNPPILVLDEATSALDTESEMMVQKALDALIDEKDGSGKTIFVIAHRLSTVKKADRIIVLDAGEIKEIGSHDELIATDGIYSRLHSLQHGTEDGTEIDATAI